jgi:hypothetical protein
LLKFVLFLIISAFAGLAVLWLFNLNPKIITMETTNKYKAPLTIGVVSDTHIPTRAEKLPKTLLTQLEQMEVKLILHAGDITRKEVIGELEKIAPVLAVAGNMDPANLNLPKSRAIKVGEYKIGLIHNTLNPLSNKMLYTAKENNLDLIIFGHTHRHLLKEKKGIWFLNPGSATDPKLQKPSFGLINIKEGKIEPEIITLD